MSCFPAAVPVRPASELVEELPSSLGSAREKMLYELYAAGQFPTWLRRWVEVTVEYDGMRGSIYVMPDFLCIGTDDEYCYTPMGAIGAEKVLSLFGAVLPTPKIVDLLYKRTCFPQLAQPWGPPYDGSMLKTSRWMMQTRKVKSAMEASGAKPGDLVEGHFKNVTTSPLVPCNKGEVLSFYGWYMAGGIPIQRDSGAHGAGYCDYSHGIRGVLQDVVVEGVMMSLAEACADEELAPMFSWDGAFAPYTYEATRALHGVTGVKYH